MGFVVPWSHVSASAWLMDAANAARQVTDECDFRHIPRYRPFVRHVTSACILQHSQPFDPVAHYLQARPAQNDQRIAADAIHASRASEFQKGCLGGPHALTV